MPWPAPTSRATIRWWRSPGISYQGGLGFEVGNENLAFGVNGNVQFGAKTSGYGVLGTFRYEF